MKDRSIQLDLRVLLIAVLVTAIGLGVALIIVLEGTDEALATTALVLAVIAFSADLAIALVFNMTNTQVQTALTKIDSRTDEITNLVRLQSERLLDMLEVRVLESVPPAERGNVATALAKMRDRLRDQPLLPVLTPPQGGIEGRKDTLRAELEQWIANQGYQLAGSPLVDFVKFEADGVIHAVWIHAGPIGPNIATAFDVFSDEIRTEWPDYDVRFAVLLEESQRSGWDGVQGSIDGLPDGTRIATPSRLDELLGDSPSS